VNSQVIELVIEVRKDICKVHMEITFSEAGFDEELWEFL
jgi:hypothetical protein